MIRYPMLTPPATMRYPVLNEDVTMSAPSSDLGRRSFTSLGLRPGKDAEANSWEAASRHFTRPADVIP